MLTVIFCQATSGTSLINVAREFQGHGNFRVRSCNDTLGWIKEGVLWRAPCDWNLPVRFII